MKPVEFILWMNGATGVMGDEPPTPEQWAAIKEKLGEAVGGIVSNRLLEKAEEVMRNEEREQKQYAEKMRLEMEMRRTQNELLKSLRGESISGATGRAILTDGLEPDPRADHMKDAIGLLKRPFFGGKK